MSSLTYKEYMSLAQDPSSGFFLNIMPLVFWISVWLWLPPLTTPTLLCTLRSTLLVLADVDHGSMVLL
ncbi:CEL_1a_G0014740.mRNA.1.CDS.1 [Saccharomyces cerevisiae]|nr:CEL_1a_G0014740.mRNA.1.CDS.1 [Saccharomyces cerevisiae]CAI7256738.1 CEL_1a_G0014740.mRNA.1.CDS.1 [Saccharomyces cerevisiae]